MPAELPDEIVDGAEAAVTFAMLVRRRHRRRTHRGTEQRERDIEMALERLKDAMLPLRSEIGRFQYGPQTTIAENNRQRIRDCSAALQSERRKLWKMQQPNRRSPTP